MDETQAELRRRAAALEAAYVETGDPPGTTKRKNSTYRSFNLLNDQSSRFDKLAEAVGMKPNALMRLIAECLKRADVEALKARR